MDHLDLEVFLAIVGSGTVSGAAGNLFLSPSTVSARLRSLEEELGYDLVLRRKGYKAVQLTPKGEQFVTYAREWLDIWNKSQALKDQPDRVRLSIGTITSMLHSTALAVRQFQQNHPHSHVEVVILDSDVSWDLVQHHKIDVALIMYPSTAYPQVHTEVLFEEDAVIIYGPAWSAEDELPAEDQILVAWTEGLERLTMSVGLRVNSITLLLELFNERSWAIVPRSIGKIMQDRGLGQIKDYDDPSLHRTIYGICHKQNQKNPVIREFLGQVIDAQEA